MTDKITEIAGKSDEELMKLFGINKDLERAKEGLAAMNKLEGEARKIAVKRLEDMLAPHVYTGELKYIAESAQRQADKKANPEKCTPCSMCEDAGAIDPD